MRSQCLNNLRQVTLGYRLALDEDPSPRIGEGAVAEWHLTQRGGSSQAWLCPSAPLTRPKDGMYYLGGGSYMGGIAHSWFVADNTTLRLQYRGFSNYDTGPKPRASSYTFNGWLHDGDANFLNDGAGAFVPWEFVYSSEDQLSHPSATPILGDGNSPMLWPRATDGPPISLIFGMRPSGQVGVDSTGMLNGYSIPRHGRRPKPLPKTWPANQRLPGAINVAFFDGHVEQVRLEGLWQLYWHKDYQPPAKRPGLK